MPYNILQENLNYNLVTAGFHHEGQFELIFTTWLHKYIYIVSLNGSCDFTDQITDQDISLRSISIIRSSAVGIFLSNIFFFVVSVTRHMGGSAKVSSSYEPA